MTTEPTQLTLPLEYPVADNYTVELLRGAGDEAKSVRKHDALSSPEDALAIVEALRDDARVRYMVTWQTEEPIQGGKIFGLAPGGIVYEINVSPALDLTEL